MLKYQYEIDHTHVYGWVRVVKDSGVHMHMESQIEKAHYKQQPERRQELLLDTVMLLIALYIVLGCLDGYIVWLFPSS